MHSDGKCECLLSAWLVGWLSVLILLNAECILASWLCILLVLSASDSNRFGFLNLETIGRPGDAQATCKLAEQTELSGRATDRDTAVYAFHPEV